jgi:hypothetical protein
MERILIAFFVVTMGGCSPTAAKVKELLDDQGYDHIEIDPTNNDLGMFHFTAKRGTQSCRGTVSYPAEGLFKRATISATCTVDAAEIEKDLERRMKAIEKRDAGAP